MEEHTDYVSKDSTDYDNTDLEINLNMKMKPKVYANEIDNDTKRDYVNSDPHSKSEVKTEPESAQQKYYSNCVTTESDSSNVDSELKLEVQTESDSSTYPGRSTRPCRNSVLDVCLARITYHSMADKLYSHEKEVEHQSPHTFLASPSYYYKLENDTDNNPHLLIAPGGDFTSKDISTAFGENGNKYSGFQREKFTSSNSEATNFRGREHPYSDIEKELLQKSQNINFFIEKRVVNGSLSTTEEVSSVCVDKSREYDGSQREKFTNSNSAAMEVSGREYPSLKEILKKPIDKRIEMDSIRYRNCYNQKPSSIIPHKTDKTIKHGVNSSDLGCSNPTTYRQHSTVKIINDIHEACELCDSGRAYYRCYTCQTTFPSKNHLRCHLIVAHKEDKPFKCKVCDKSYTRYASLQAHRKTSLHMLNAKRLSNWNAKRLSKSSQS